jgi:hypothetical protein
MGWPFEELGFNSQQGQKTFLFYIASKLAVGPVQSSMQWVLAVFFEG